MVSVGIEGSRVTDGNALTAALLQTGATAAQIQAAQLTAMAHPTWFVPVISLTQARYEQLKPVVYPVPGTVFNTFGARSPLTPELGRPRRRHGGSRHRGGDPPARPAVPGR